MEQTTITISKELRDRLKFRGRKGETYEDIISRLLNSDEFEEKSTMNFGQSEGQDD